MKPPLGNFYFRSLDYLNKPIRELQKQRLWVKIIVGMLTGIAIGMLLSPATGWIEHEKALLLGEWLAIPGKIFLGLIQMIVVPLVFASIIRGIASSEDMEFLKRMGLRIVFYFAITTSFAIGIGLTLAIILKPGQYIDQSLLSAVMREAPAVEIGQPLSGSDITSIPEFFIKLLPNNPLAAMVETQMLQIVIFALILGIALVSMEKSSALPLLELMGSVQEVCMIVVRWAMMLAPVAVFGLLAQITIKIGLDALLGMAAYVGTVLFALFFLLCFYCLIVYLIARESPRRFLNAIRPVQLLAFSTSSSAAVMPLSMQTAEEKLNVRPSISQFLIPLGTTINMDGTALYQGVATVFLAQAFGVDLSFTTLLLILLTTVGASIGSPATPGVGIVILATILKNAGIPSSGIALILGVDRILDMSRTALNVTGDLTASLVMNRWLGGTQNSKITGKNI
ncbi:MAG: dicarboxylate/amino acid:cation symporter [Syntrophomonadaceae bacterium]|nr:dicarboxylate/amino acid:cation symporter [Syntrophomonadaceae bacterium]